MFFVCSDPNSLNIPEYNLSHINLYICHDACNEEFLVNADVSFIPSRHQTGADKTEPILTLLCEILLVTLVSRVNPGRSPLFYDRCNPGMLVVLVGYFSFILAMPDCQSSKYMSLMVRHHRVLGPLELG